MARCAPANQAAVRSPPPAAFSNMPHAYAPLLLRRPRCPPSGQASGAGRKQRSRPNRRVPAPPRPHSPLESGRRACGTQPGGFWAWTVACALDPKRTDCAAPQHSRPGPIGSRTCCSNTARRAALATSCHHFCSSGSVLTYPLTCKSNVITSRGVTTLPRGTGKLHTEKQPVVPLENSSLLLPNILDIFD